MNASHSSRVLSRRSAFTGLAAGGLGLAVATQGIAASTRQQQPNPSAHPIIGTWLVRSVNGMGLATFSVDGSYTHGAPASRMGPRGVIFASVLMGQWESTGARSAHVTAIQMLSDGVGTFTGTVTNDSHPVVSADGLSLLDNAPETAIITRDASDQVVSVVGGNGGAPPMVGRRIGPDSGIFQAGPPATENQGT